MSEIRLDPEEVRSIVEQVIAQAMVLLGWPPGRLAVTEAEAAACLGTKKHVLRDLRLRGLAEAVKIGRQWHYTLQHLMVLLKQGAVIEKDINTNMKGEKHVD